MTREYKSNTKKDQNNSEVLIVVTWLVSKHTRKNKRNKLKKGIDRSIIIRTLIIKLPIHSNSIMWNMSESRHVSRKYHFTESQAKEILKDILPKTATLSDTENINHLKVDSNAEPPFVCKLDNSNQAKIRFLTLFFGENDASFPENKQSVPLEEYKANLSEMIQMVTDPKSKYYSKYTKIILITPPVVCDIMWEKRLKEFGVNTQNRSNTCAKIYSDAATQVGKNHNVAVVNLWEAFNNRIQQLFDTDIDTSLNEDIVGYSLDKSSPTFGFDQLLSGGLHPNKAGNDLIIKEVMAAIEKNYPELCPENISFTIPICKNILQTLDVVNLWEAFNNRIQQLFDTDIDTSLKEEIVGYSLDKSSPTFGFDQLLSDRLHPNKAGNDLIIKEVMAAIEKNYPELCPENIFFTIPICKNILQTLDGTKKK
ncbi:hypothetical protein BB561_003547 [Smittium simulii]|uniref:Uncharacterized protein n=1 Tax=Smittium simulii TaxID=133385 RepID=A0A2T9YKN8_9FUNG|nr:hypothetical protein BB561_003547 [Smittium simulii]